MAPEISVLKWQEKSAGCIRILRTHDSEMKEFFNQHIFDPLKIRKERLLDKDSSDLRMLFLFACTQKGGFGGVSGEYIRNVMNYFNEHRDELIKILNAENEPNVKFEQLCEIIYYPKKKVGIGQKIGGLFLKLLVMCGEQKPELLPYLYLPIDQNVAKVFKELGTPPIEMPGRYEPDKYGHELNIRNKKFKRFQTTLWEIAMSNGGYRIHFDYFWHIGRIFCRYNNCEKCWLQSICLNKEI